MGLWYVCVCACTVWGATAGLCCYRCECEITDHAFIQEFFGKFRSDFSTSFTKFMANKAGDRSIETFKQCSLIHARYTAQHTEESRREICTRLFYHATSTRFLFLVSLSTNIFLFVRFVPCLKHLVCMPMIWSSIHVRWLKAFGISSDGKAHNSTTISICIYLECEKFRANHVLETRAAHAQ